jgi:hypothetical protein
MEAEAPEVPAAQPRPPWRARAAASARSAAGNPGCNRAQLWLLGLFGGNSRGIAGALAGNPATRRWLLSWITRRSLQRGHWNVVMVALEHPACSTRLYRKLLWSSFPAVEVAAAANPRASSALLNRLGHFTEPWLRLYMATNPSAPPEVIDLLLADRDPYVRRVAAAHSAVTVEGLRRLCADFSQPAWILRAAATNPVCPADLADQLLTWLALGGAGASDPHFDPIACTGQPDSTEGHSNVWYVNAARQEDAETHALWRVRAAIPVARQRIPIAILKLLARDPRPEVRRQSARFRALPFPVLRELVVDTDPAVARLAESALRDKPKERGKQARRLVLRGLPIVIFVLVANSLIDSRATPSITGLSPPSATSPSISSGSTGYSGTVQVADGISLPAIISGTSTVGGDGKIEAGTLNGISSLPNLPFISVAAGTVSLTVTVPGAFTFGPTVTAESSPLRVGANQQTVLVLPADPTSIDVTVNAPGQASVTLAFEFDVTTS